VVLVVVGIVVGVQACATFSSAPTSTPAASGSNVSASTVVAEAHTALAAQSLGNGATMDSLVDVIRVSTEGGVAVTITLNQTSAALEGSSGTNGLQKIATAYENTVMNAAPEVTGVAVVDANNSIIDAATRK
jgi:hypothetical protein